MEQRHTQIREGAGLEESRLNQDFIDFLRKWSTPILMVAALISLGVVGQRYWKKHQAEKLDKAFEEYDGVSGSENPSPDSLKRIAEEFAGEKAVPMLARLDAADAYMRSVRAGVKAGGVIKDDGSLNDPADAISEEERKTYLDQAEKLYQQARQDASSAAHITFRIGAIFGLAAVAESRLDYDTAKQRYEEIIKMTEDGPFAAHAAIARHRLDLLPELKELPRVYSKAELPTLPELPPPPAAPGTPTIVPVENPPFIAPQPAGPEPIPAGSPPDPAPAPSPAPEPAPEPTPDPK